MVIQCSNNYNSLIARAKMCEISLTLTLRPSVSSLDFPMADECQDKQLACVRVIRRCLDLTTFMQPSAGRARDSHRYCKDDVFRFSVGGQGHCHTVTSVMAAILVAWSAVIGIDVKYRDTMSFPMVFQSSEKLTHQKGADSPETHHWIEYSTVHHSAIWKILRMRPL